MRVLVTGGAGYIGSHTCLELLAADHEIFVIDNLCNGHFEAIERVRELSKRALGFAEIDIRDGGQLDRVFDDFKPDAVIHLAGLKAVGESVLEPLRYYNVNVRGSISLLEAMDRAGCGNIVFSSSATVYGDPEYLPYDEEHPTRPVNPYGHTKLMVEDILRDWTAVDTVRRATALRSGREDLPLLKQPTTPSLSTKTTRRPNPTLGSGARDLLRCMTFISAARPSNIVMCSRWANLP